MIKLLNAIKNTDDKYVKDILVEKLIADLTTYYNQKPQYMTVDNYVDMYFPHKYDKAARIKIGKKCTKWCKQHDIEITKAHDKWNSNMYPTDVINNIIEYSNL